MLYGAKKNKVIGIDISIETTTYAIIDVRGNIIAKDVFSTIDYPDVNSYVVALCDRIVNLIQDNCSMDEVRSIGISAPSGNFKTGCIENSPNNAVAWCDTACCHVARQARSGCGFG